MRQPTKTPGTGRRSNQATNQKRSREESVLCRDKIPRQNGEVKPAQSRAPGAHQVDDGHTAQECHRIPDDKRKLYGRSANGAVNRERMSGEGQFR